MQRINHFISPAKLSETLQHKLGKLWNSLDENENGVAEPNWNSLFNNIRQMLIKEASEPGFPFDFNLGESKFAKYSKQMSNANDKGTLKKLILRAGSGDVIPINCVVYVFYRAFLENGEYPFTSSAMHGPGPRRYQMGSGTLCKGFEAAIATMKIGEKAHFILQPDMAFGSLGNPPRVPPNAEILLEVELADIVKHDKKYPSIICIRDHRENIIDNANKLNKLANDYYKNGNFVYAIINYRKAENLLTTIKCTGVKEEKCRKIVFLKLIINQIITYVNAHKTLNRPQEAISAALRAYQLVPAESATSAKLKYNLARAYLLMDEEEKATQLLTTARKIEPNNNFIEKLYLKLINERNYRIKNAAKCWESVKSKFPEHKSEEEYMEFLKASMRQDLLNYIKQPLVNFGMPWNYTSHQRTILSEEAEKMDLAYEEIKIQPSNMLISIHKKGTAMLLSERNIQLHGARQISNDENDSEETEFFGWEIFRTAPNLSACPHSKVPTSLKNTLTSPAHTVYKQHVTTDKDLQLPPPPTPRVTNSDILLTPGTLFASPVSSPTNPSACADSPLPSIFQDFADSALKISTDTPSTSTLQDSVNTPSTSNNTQDSTIDLFSISPNTQDSLDIHFNSTTISDSLDLYSLPTASQHSTDIEYPFNNDDLLFDSTMSLLSYSLPPIPIPSLSPSSSSSSSPTIHASPSFTVYQSLDITEAPPPQTPKTSFTVHQSLGITEVPPPQTPKPSFTVHQSLGITEAPPPQTLKPSFTVHQSLGITEVPPPQTLKPSFTAHQSLGITEVPPQQTPKPSFNVHQSLGIIEAPPPQTPPTSPSTSLKTNELSTSAISTTTSPLLKQDNDSSESFKSPSSTSSFENEIVSLENEVSSSFTISSTTPKVKEDIVYVISDSEEEEDDDDDEVKVIFVRSRNSRTCKKK